MHTRNAALLVAASILLAACADAPTAARGTPDLRHVTITRGDGSGVPLRHAARAPAGPRYVCTVDGGCTFPEERPMAEYDYYSGGESTTSGGTTQAHLYAVSWGGEGIDAMTLNASFKIASGDGAYGCSATPLTFDTGSTSGATGYLVIDRWITWPSSEHWVLGVDSEHYFHTAYGYSLDGAFQRSGTFYTSWRTCV